MRKLRWFLIPLLTVSALITVGVGTGVFCSHPEHWLSNITERFHPYTPPPDFEAHTIITHATRVESFTLSPTSRQNDDFGVRLISIAPDGTTEIEATHTSTRLTSTPGQPFASQEFGRQGLVLRSSSSDTQTAIFDRWSCRTTTQTATK